MQDPLITALLDLDRALEDRVPLLLGGGYGLFLKQEFLQQQSTRTFLPWAALPPPRTTEDLDLFLRADIATDSTRMGELRAALDQLGFRVIQSARFYQFVRERTDGVVKIDLLAGPLGNFESRVKPDPRRVKPIPAVDLHARRTEEALGIEHSPLHVPVRRTTTEGNEHSCHVLIPQALPAVLMKLAALRDRINDPRKNEGRHHALDLFRIVGLLTQRELELADEITSESSTHPALVNGRRDAVALFASPTSLGRRRLMEHASAPSEEIAERCARQLFRLLGTTPDAA